MKLKDLIKKLQSGLNEMGEKLTVDGEWGPKSETALTRYDVEFVLSRKIVRLEPPAEKAPVPTDRPVNPAYIEAKKYDGQNEKKKTWVAWLSKFWPKAGLNYKTIIGSSFAWCGLFALAMNSEVGQKAITGAAGARNWAKYGVEVEWRENGIPRGAILHINGGGNCSSGKLNHVTFADGDCRAQDLIEMVKGSDGTYKAIVKSGATVPGFGGNQGDSVKRSIYPVRNLCAVRWPAEIPLPPPVTKSINCKTENATGDSTR